MLSTQRAAAHPAASITQRGAGRHDRCNVAQLRHGPEARLHHCQIPARKSPCCRHRARRCPSGFSSSLRNARCCPLVRTWLPWWVAMKGSTVKLPDTMLRRLRQEARATGRSVAALIRERLEVVGRGSNDVPQGIPGVGPSMRSPLILRAAWPVLESLQPTTGAGSHDSDRNLRHGTTGSVSKPQRSIPYHSWAVALMKQVRSPMLGPR